MRWWHLQMIKGMRWIVILSSTVNVSYVALAFFIFFFGPELSLEGFYDRTCDKHHILSRTSYKYKSLP